MISSFESPVDATNTGHLTVGPTVRLVIAACHQPVEITEVLKRGGVPIGVLFAGMAHQNLRRLSVESFHPSPHSDQVQDGSLEHCQIFRHPKTEISINETVTVRKSE